MSEGEKRAYDAPYPSARYQAGARAFPRLVPMSPDDPAGACEPRRMARARTLEQALRHGVQHRRPITRGLDRVLARRIPGAQGRTHTRVRGGHFLQEVSGPELAKIVIATAREAAPS